MSQINFQTLDIDALRAVMAKVHEQVSEHHGRIELTRSGCDGACVILSKAELQSLERALEILSETAEYRAMCENLSRLATDCGASGPATDLLYPER